MRKFLSGLILLFSTVVFSSLIVPKTSKALISTYQIDNADYQLNIIEANIPPLKDTVFGGNQCLITKCPLTLTNKTDDTLKYVCMSASWWDNYDLDNKNFSLAADYWNVFKNGPVTRILLPHQSVSKNIKIITYKDYFRGQKLKIAMHLQKVVKLPIVGEVTPIGSDSNFLIWSNEVTIH